MKPLYHLAHSLSILVVFALIAAMKPAAPIHTQASSGQPVQLKDINPGSEYSMPRNFIQLNGKDFFIARDVEHGQELWVTDGTPEGTNLFLDVNPGPADGLLNPIHRKDFTEQATANGVLYFAAADSQNGFELWRTDGTLAGTWQVKDIRPGPEGSYPGVFTNVNGVVFFVVAGQIAESEVWKTDGTAAGTQLVKDVAPGSFGVQYQSAVMAPLGNLLIFGVNYSSYYKLWRSDGTEAGTFDFFGPEAYGMDPIQNWPRFMLPHNGLIYLDLSIQRVTNTGDQLWVTDGTRVGTKKIGTKIGDTNYKHYGARELTWIGDTLYFIAEDRTYPSSSPTGYGIWKLPPGSLEAEEVVGPLDSVPSTLTRLGGTRMVYWRYNSATQKSGLWITDGTGPGTSVICPDCFGVLDYYATPFFGKVYFSADSNIPAFPGDTSGMKIWTTDGSGSGTQLFSSIRPHWSYYAFGKHLYFSAKDSATGMEPWVYDTPLNNHLYLPNVIR